MDTPTYPSAAIADSRRFWSGKSGEPKTEDEEVAVRSHGLGGRFATNCKAALKDWWSRSKALTSTAWPPPAEDSDEADILG